MVYFQNQAMAFCDIHILGLIQPILRFDEYYPPIFPIKSKVSHTHKFNGTTWL